MSPDVVSETWTSPVSLDSGQTCLSKTLPAKPLTLRKLRDLRYQFATLKKAQLRGSAKFVVQIHCGSVNCVISGCV